MNNTKVGYIYSTKDYDEFKKLNGNRSVLEQRKTMILKSIKERGWIRNPIVVNEKMEMIDGQGRFEALKELGLPIEYCISEGATINDCIALNLKQKNWGTVDYINCYAELGNENYIALLGYINRYKNLGAEPVSIMLSRGHGSFSGRDTRVVTGRFIMEDAETADNRMKFLNDAMVLIGKSRGRTRCWATALRFIYNCPSIDNDSFLKALQRYITLLNVCVDVDGAVKSLEFVYNYNRKSGKVYFIPEFDKYKEAVKKSA